MTTPRPVPLLAKPLSTMLGEQIMEIRSRLHTLLTHSNLAFHDFSNSNVVIVGASSYWAALPDEARPL